MSLIQLKDVYKIYAEGQENQVNALDGVTLSIDQGEFVAIIGTSGSGKSTMMNILGCLDVPTRGEYLLDGTPIRERTQRELSQIRSRQIAFIFQGYNLIPSLNVWQNVALPMLYQRVPLAERRARAMEALEKVEIAAKADNRPAQLSGGQQQRIAIARALATDPKVLLCDEATSALDPKTTHAILELIRDINQRLGITVIIITHQMSVVEEICSRVAILDSGSVVEEGVVSEVFSSPKSKAAKRLVFPDGADEILEEVPGERRIRVVFSGAVASREPLIAKMAIDEQITASILGASTKSIGDKAYGNMLLGLPDDDDVVKRAISYLSSIPDVLVEEVTGDVR